MNCRAAPTLRTSFSEAWKPSRQSLRTKPSGAWRTSLVRNRTDLSASRRAATASTAPGTTSSPTHRQPSRSTSTWSYRRRAGERGTRAALSLAAVPRSLAVIPACLALALAGCGSSSDDEKSGQSGASTPEATETAAAANQFLPQGCEDDSKPAPKDVGKLKQPTGKLSEAKTYVATVSTTCGDFQITLDAKRAPVTGGSFKYLADHKFFDDLNFHRIVAGFVIQGGDPHGDGSGGPGWTVVEAPPKDLTYDAGVVAMAKTDTDPPGASGSQFFVVTGSGAASLQPIYALLGEVTQGLDVAQKIGGIQSDPTTGQPAWPVVIKSVRVKVS